MLQRDTEEGEPLSWPRGGNESVCVSPAPAAQFGMKSTHGRIRKTKGRRAGAAGKFRQRRLKILEKHYYTGQGGWWVVNNP